MGGERAFGQLVKELSKALLAVSERRSETRSQYGRKLPNVKSRGEASSFGPGK